VTLSSAALIANAAPTYTFSILESEPDWAIPNLSSYNDQLSRPAGPIATARATDINDSGALAGYISSNSGNDRFAALWSNSDAQYTQLQSLGGAAKQGEAFGISNSGHIVGYSQNASDVYQATLWSPTSYSPTHLQSFFGGNKAGEAWGINNSGQIVGISFDTVSTNYYLLPDRNSRATLWDGTNIINLNTYLDTSNNPDGWVLNAAWRIDNDGSIYGAAFKEGIGDKYFSLQSVTAPVPEADTSAMLLMGAGVMGFMARRRKQVAA
jgi:probable HAF family extracellular repeat protein